jgi:hypothetical protein
VGVPNVLVRVALSSSLNLNELSAEAVAAAGIADEGNIAIMYKLPS